MPYYIKCTNSKCGEYTGANTIVDLISEHLDSVGKIICTYCGQSGAFIYRESKLQEEGEIWARWIKGVITIDTGIPTYSPYIFLTSQNEQGPVNGAHFHYYKDTRPDGGKLKHGHGPGGPPVLSKDEIFQLLEKMIVFGCLDVQEIIDFTDRLK
jgi:hypothetical protein